MCILPGFVPGEQQACAGPLTALQNEFHAAGITTSISLTSECPPADALLLKERQFGPDLIVVGTEPKSPVDRFLLGSTAEHLIRNATVPVLTIGPNAKRPNSSPLLFNNIVFAADFSGASNRAGAFALTFARDAGAHLSFRCSGCDYCWRGDILPTSAFMRTNLLFTRYR